MGCGNSMDLLKVDLSEGSGITKDKEMEDCTEGRSAVKRPAFCDFWVQTVCVPLMEVPSV